MATMNLLNDLAEMVLNWLASQGYQIDKNINFDKLFACYLDKFKRIPPQIRWRINISKELSGKELSNDIRKSLDIFIKKAEAGNNLCPHISSKIEDPWYIDKLLYDWDIHHFHLGWEHRASGKVKWTPGLLFCNLQPSTGNMYLLDFLPHGDQKTEYNPFVETELIAILENNWPEILDRYALKLGSNKSRPSPSKQEIANMRSKNVGYGMPLKNGNLFYSPEGGLGGDDSHHQFVIQRVRHLIEDAEKQILFKRDEFEQKYLAAYSKNWEDLHFKLTKFGEVVEVTELSTGSIILSETFKTLHEKGYF